MQHLCTFFDINHKGHYSYRDRFRTVFRTLSRLTLYENIDTSYYSTKVAILDNQKMFHYVNTNRQNKVVEFEYDPELSDDGNKIEYEKFLSKVHRVRRPLNVQPNFNVNALNVFGFEFASIFKNVIWMSKNRKKVSSFHICQFKGTFKTANRYGTMDYVCSKVAMGLDACERVTNFEINWERNHDAVNCDELVDWLDNNSFYLSQFREDMVLENESEE